MQPVVYAADIGSIPGRKFGWARIDPAQDTAVVERGSGVEILDLVSAVASDLNAGRGVALGIECPIFVPVPSDPLRLGKARTGERDRSWSAGAGTGAMATGLVQMAWMLDQLHTRVGGTAAYLDWNEFNGAGGGLFLWEAFVTSAAKAATHVGDALIAAEAFRQALPSPFVANAVTAERPLSLVGAALLWSGWSSDISVLGAPSLVIKAVPRDAGY